MNFVTPYSGMLEEGQYEVSFPLQAIVGGKSCAFGSWEDGSTDPTRLINLNADMNIAVNYFEVIPTANVNFNGMITAQVVVGEIVTVTVTFPDGTKDVLTTTTKTDLTYTISKVYNIAGAYSAVMTMPADAQYSTITTSIATFNIPLANRTGTLTVTLG